MRLTQEVFIPQLQKSVNEAKTQAPFTEVLSASASAYAQLLHSTVGRDAAVKLLNSLASHIGRMPEVKSRVELSSVLTGF